MKHFILMEQLKNLQKSISRLNGKQTMTLSESIRDLQNRIRLLKESGVITNSPIPQSADGQYPDKLISILRDIEGNGLTLSYSRIKSASGLRYVIDVNQNQNYFGASVTSKNDRQDLYNAMMQYILKKYKSTVKLFDSSDSNINDKFIYIKTTRLGEKTIGFIIGANVPIKTVPSGFSTAGGLEFYVAKEGRSYFVDFEIKGSARADSAVNTKLREVTPCILFELYGRKKTYNSFLKSLFANPASKFENVKKDILALSTLPVSMTVSLPNCTIAVLRDTFGFENNATNAFRMKAFVVGVKTLEHIFNEFGKENIEYIKFTGLSTMTGGSSGSTEDIIVVKKPIKNKPPEEVKISLKSGAYKSRDTTFAKFLSILNENIPNVDVSIDYVNGKTSLVGNGKKYILKVNAHEENPETVADKFFTLLNKLNEINRVQFASAVKKLILPDENMEIWNVTETGFEDLKSDYLDFYKYKYVSLERKPGTQYYVIVMSNPSEVSLNKENRSFRFRWYKRSGKGLLGEYKVLAEPNKQ